MNGTNNNWYLKLFKKSILKQSKLRAILSLLGPVEGKSCLDLGGDNGIISYYLREKGGQWSSVDLEDKTVESIRSLVKTSVYRIDGEKVPFENKSLDVVVIIDFLEHIHTDKIFIEELYRSMKDGGIIIINVPHLKRFSVLHGIRNIIGLTDEKHGHVRPGYTLRGLSGLLGKRFEIVESKTYSRFFSEFIDTIISFVYSIKNRKKGSGEVTSKGILVTEKDFEKGVKAFKLYSAIYPFVWLISKLDILLFFTKGYGLIVKARKI